jgi:hypothetical protein
MSTTTQTQSDRDAEATRRLLAIAGTAHPRALNLLAVDPGAVCDDGLPFAGVRWLSSDDPAWRRPPGGIGCWTLGAGLVPLGLCELAGLLSGGDVGVPEPRGGSADAAAAGWRQRLSNALPHAPPEAFVSGSPEFLFDDGGRPLAREEFLGAPRGTPLKMRVGESWVDVEVMGHLGDGGGPIHVGVRRGAEVVGYTLTWADCSRMLRVPTVASTSEPSIP